MSQNTTYYCIYSGPTYCFLALKIVQFYDNSGGNIITFCSMQKTKYNNFKLILFLA